MANFGMFRGGLTLKALLENPDLQNAPIPNKSEKEKKENDLPFDAPSAFLGPNLWDRTYDNTDINLEYMDLDEFLSENGIPVNLDALGNDIIDVATPSNSNQESIQSAASASNVSPLPLLPQSPRSTPPVSPKQQPVSSVPSPTEHKSNVALKADPASPGSDLDVKIDFSMSPSDMALVCVPGEENFDPRRRTFSEEELKPQPMIKKSKKIFIHEEAKDDKYWARRKKNNVAAKRSRDARRIKENQIAMRAAFLEKENNVLKSEMEKIKKENSRLKTSLAKYEPTST